MTVVVGIDPGLSGAVSAIYRDGRCAVEDLPTMPLPGNGLVKRKIDGRALILLLRRLVPAGEAPKVLLEQVRAMGGKNNAVQTQFSLGRTLGGIETLLEGMGWHPTMVEPQEWKKSYGLGANKAECLARARELYPAVAGTALKRALDHNRAESLLIAHYGLRNLT